MKHLPKTIILLLTLSMLTGCFGSKSEQAAKKPETAGKTNNLDLAELLGGQDTAQVPSSQDQRDTKTYTHEEYGFSFQYPTDLTVSEFAEGEYGDTILVQELAGATKEPATTLSRFFQIFISEFDEPDPLTATRIKQDLPDMVVEQPQQVIIGNSTNSPFPALIFFSEEEGLGKTREIWFVYSGYLYQISTHAGLDGFIGGVMETWRFE